MIWEVRPPYRCNESDVIICEADDEATAIEIGSAHFINEYGFFDGSIGLPLRPGAKWEARTISPPVTYGEISWR